MSSILLVDSSVWIDHYRNRLQPAVLQRLTRAMQDDRAALAPMIWLELMVGFRSREEQQHRENIRGALRWLEPPDDLWERAAGHAATLHASGVVLRMPDLLVLTMAQATDSRLLHCDKDFDRALKLRPFARLRVELN
jgi:predicted nucleic acid-binding protein